MSQHAAETSPPHGIILAGPRDADELSLIAPRALLPVAQQPLITYALRWMRQGALRQATVCSDSDSPALRACVDAAAPDLQVRYLEDVAPRGPAGSVRDAAAGVDADTLVVADATALPVVDLAALVEAHHAAGAAMTVVVARDAMGRLRPTGAYVLERAVCSLVPEHGFYDIKEQLVPQLYAAGENVGTFLAASLAPRVLNAHTYLALNAWVIERALGDRQPPEGFSAREGALVHTTALLDRDARLLGPVMIGPGASIQGRATLVGPLSIGARSTIGQAAVVSRSVVADGCLIGERALVDRAVIGEGSRIAARVSVLSGVHAASPAEERASWTPSWRLAWAAIRNAISFPETQSS